MHLPILKLLDKKTSTCSVSLPLQNFEIRGIDWVNNMCLIFFSRAFKQTGAPGEFLTL